MSKTRKKRSRESERRQMVATLHTMGIVDRRVIDAMQRVDRRYFVLPDMKPFAYEDRPLPIGFGQTISQPFTVAFMCEAARIADSDRVLEIGTGSGYGATVLSRLAREVHTVERIPMLAKQARDRLRRLRYENVRVHEADGTLGLAEAAPYDAIIVTAGASALPSEYVEQLREAGRIVIPIGPHPRHQTMYRFTLTQTGLIKESLGHYSFVPLIGACGWQSETPQESGH